MTANLYALFHSRFADHLDTPCLRLPDGAMFTYGDMDDLSSRFAGVLRRSDVTPGDRVVVQVDKSVANVALYLACLRAGAIFVPLNTAYTPSEVAYFLNDATPKVFVCRPGRDVAATAAKAGVAHVKALGTDAGSPFWAEALRAEPDTAIAPRGDDDLAAICYTSGTTGRSKGAMLTCRNLASNALTLHKLWGFAPGDVLLHALPIYHVHGLFVALNTAFLNASEILFLPRFDADQVMDLLPRASVMMGVPTFYTRLLERADFTAEAAAHVRLFISGSAPLTEAAFRAFEDRTGMKILERYGMTETGMITSNPLDGDRVAGTVGYALPEVEVRVADDTGAEVRRGEVGVVEVRGPNVFKGYWQMPDKTAEEFRPDGFFITGDMATMAEDGRMTIVGRAKDLIISGGFNIYPKEIEVVLDDMDGVAESAVIGVPHPDFGEGVVAVLVADGDARPDGAAIEAALGARLARFKHPKKIVWADALPRNAMGKVQKNVLRKRYDACLETAG